MTEHDTIDPADLVSDVTPEPSPETFDLNDWFSGVTGTVRAVTLYKRSDLIGEIDALQRELRLAEAISDDDRGINDATPESVKQQLEEVAREFEGSALVFKVEGRSEEALERIAKRLKKQGVTDSDTITLHQIHDAILEPKGVTLDSLRTLSERNESQYKLLIVATTMANQQPPQVSADFLSRTSGGRKRDRSS